ncbi:hypothetical protein [Brevibacillus sp. SYSU BS000544]|uniref:hypothetical protein n=1 Tax=Brevibacillus sp. SYSU BS000544 TaxID=3416443 RepID=UPI003CE56B32
MSTDILVTVNSIALGIITILLAVVGFFLKDIYNTNRQQQQRSEIAIKKLEDDLSKHKESLPEKYVMREDFFREINTLERKIDTIGRDITELNKNVSSLVSLVGGNTNGK